MSRLVITIVVLMNLGTFSQPVRAADPVCGKIKKIAFRIGAFLYLYANGNQYFYSQIDLDGGKSLYIPLFANETQTDLVTALSGGLEVCFQESKFRNYELTGPAKTFHLPVSVSK